MIALLICQMGRWENCRHWLQYLQTEITIAESANSETPVTFKRCWNLVWQDEEFIRTHYMPPARGGEHLDRRKDKV